MAVEQISASFVKIDDSSNTAPTETSVYQYIDVLKSDISDSNNRKNYEVFVTGGTNQANVTSTLYQTIYDQDFTLSTSNPLFDVTIGLLKEETVVNEVTVPVVNGVNYSYDSAGKIVGFNNNELMIREKVNIYRQFAQNLLGDPDSFFVAPHGETFGETGVTKIKSALFICFRRLFTRDNIHKGSFNMFISRQAPFLLNDSYSDDTPATKGAAITNINALYSEDSNLPFSELLEISDTTYGNSNVSVSPVAGEVSTLTADIDGSEEKVGLIYYDKGIVVLDTEVLFDNVQTLRGKIDSTSQAEILDPTGPWYVEDTANSNNYKDFYTSEAKAQAVDTANGGGGGVAYPLTVNGVNFFQPAYLDTGFTGAVVTTATEPSDQPEYDFTQGASNDFYDNSKVVTADAAEANLGVLLFEGTLKEFITSATIEDILTHLCVGRFGDENESAITFQNETLINSKIYYCRAAPSQLNYSTNPTYTDSEGNIVALTSNNKPFSFVTSVGLFDSTGTLVAVAKTSRPIEKNSETDLTINVRLDY